MHEYNVVLKLLLEGPARRLMRELTASPITRWLDVELPEVIHNRRLGLLGESADANSFTWNPGAPSLHPQSPHRVDSHCPPSGHITRQQRYPHKGRQHARKSSRIGSADFE